MSIRVFCVLVVAGAAALVGPGPARAADPPLTVTDRTAVAIVQPHTGSLVRSECQKGEEVVGGGFGVQASRYTEPLPPKLPSNLFPVVASFPQNTTSWTVVVANRSEEPVLFAAHAQCASRSVGVEIVTMPVGIDAAGTRIYCPRKTTMVTGGGWDLGNLHALGTDVVDIRSSYVLEDSWKIVAWPADGSTVQPYKDVFKGYALCASHSLHRGSYEPVMAVPPAGPDDMATDATIEVGCAKGELLTGAGHHIHEGTIGITTFFPWYGSAGGRWVLTVQSLPVDHNGKLRNPGGSAWAGPMCAKVS
ncbi:hypothetical protein GCM10009557_11870 [Virgisporangium ochraceum]|uniref:Secreted protein n=1 Tax=Virgisporangium ochraceum TaxID=65505 RepID=A0A8J3ZQ96_9ACTN|nr:hypothetical protein [Virgisporangium ochraceum]GIJ68434.1 hypothetical protein Voc01_033510 [Virgisporangium ochraceum]